MLPDKAEYDIFEQVSFCISKREKENVLTGMTHACVRMLPQEITEPKGHPVKGGNNMNQMNLLFRKHETARKFWAVFLCAALILFALPAA